MISIFRNDIRRIQFLLKKLASERHLDRDEWNFLLTAHFTIYAIVALILMALVVRAESFQEVKIALFFFSPLFFPLFLLNSFRIFLVQKNKLMTLGAVILMAITCFMSALGGVGYIYFINAVASPYDVRLAAGKVEKLEPRRRDAPRVFIFDGQSTISNIPISDEEYERLRPGDYYVSNLRLGGLGLYYRWSIDSWNRGWEARVPRLERKILENPTD